MFVTTGLVQWTQKLLKSKVSFSKSPEAVNNSAKANTSYVESFWKMLYRAIWRVVGLGPILLILMVTIVLPSIVDGLVTRHKKMDVFKPHNPVFFWASAHSAISTVGVFLVLPLLPFSISFLILYGSIFLVASSLWVTASNLQTGV